MISVDLPSLSLPSSDTKNEQQLHAAGRMPVALLVAVAPPAAEAETAPESGDVARAFLLTYLVERQAASDAPWKLVLTERLSFPESIGDLCRVGRHLVVAHGNRLALYTHTRCGWRPLTVSKRALASPIVALTAHEALCRIFVASLHHGISLFKYYVQENRLVLVAEDMQRRWIHRLQLLDADTVVAADKFGSIAVLRLPVESSAAIEGDPSYGRLAERYGASPESVRPFVARLMPECSVHVGSVVTSLHVFGYGAATDPDATPASAPRSWTEAEAILYGTVSGGFGMLIPFRTRAEWDIVQRLERELHLFWAKCCAPGHTMDATHTRNLLHASVLRFQGRIEPTRHVVNGHLCGLFALLDPETQRSIAARVLGLQEPSTPSEEQRALTLLLSTLHRLYARVLWPLGHEVQAAPLHAT
jgi:splicing factor 3B subunit 3